MDSEHFDALTKLLGRGITRRGVTTALAALASAGLPTLEDAGAKKKKKKRKKKKPSPAPLPSCEDLGQACTGDCCAGLTCATVGKEDCGLDGDVCCRAETDDCQDHCDCCGGLGCSGRQGDTCRDCLFQGDFCNNSNQCCDLDHSCDGNICGLTCCAQPGGTCNGTCDCCGSSTECESRGANGSVCCHPFGGSCQDDGHCCAGLLCGPQDFCCAGQGTSCAEVDECCNNLSCGSNNCFVDVCLQNAGGPCFGDSCNCAAGLNCSQRTGTCETCGLVQDTCDPENGDDDCCLTSSVCRDNNCGEGGAPNIVCCQGVGGSCRESCDCCETLLCFGEESESPTCCKTVGAFCFDDDDCCPDHQCKDVPVPPFKTCVPG